MTDHLTLIISKFCFEINFYKTEFSNWLECDTYLNNFANSGTTSNGAKYYEVLTADNTVSWKSASQFTDQEIEDQMVIVGNSEQFARKFFGLCR